MINETALTPSAKICPKIAKYPHHYLQPTGQSTKTFATTEIASNFL